MDFQVIFGNSELYVIVTYIKVYQMANDGIYPLKREQLIISEDQYKNDLTVE